MSKLTTRSIWFASCILLGLWLAYVDGIEMRALVQTALLASVLFVGFLVGEALWKKYRK